jgi:hypothetical protein
MLFPQPIPETSTSFLLSWLHAQAPVELVLPGESREAIPGSAVNHLGGVPQPRQWKRLAAPTLLGSLDPPGGETKRFGESQGSGNEGANRVSYGRFPNGQARGGEWKGR